jgi:hypothetical protein
MVTLRGKGRGGGGAYNIQTLLEHIHHTLVPQAQRQHPTAVLADHQPCHRGDELALVPQPTLSLLRNRGAWGCSRDPRVFGSLLALVEAWVVQKIVISEHSLNDEARKNCLKRSC